MHNKGASRRSVKPPGWEPAADESSAPAAATKPAEEATVSSVPDLREILQAEFMHGGAAEDTPIGRLRFNVMPNDDSFTPTSTSVGALVSQDAQCLYVPEYQRGYTWGGDHIDRFFEDSFTGIIQASVGDGPTTFLGSCIFFKDAGAVEPKHPNALPTQVLHVVDGQQRLTTWLFLCGQLAKRLRSIRHEMESITVTGEAAATQQWLLEILHGFYARLLGAMHYDNHATDDNFRYKPRMIRQSDDVWGNSATDAQYASPIAWYLRALAIELHDGAIAPVVPGTLGRLTDALAVIDENLDRIESGQIVDCPPLEELSFVNSDEACGRLLNRLECCPTPAPALTDLQRRGIRLAVMGCFALERIRVISVIAPNENYAFTLFEPLNTTGQPLTPLETLKPLVVQSEGGSQSYRGSPSAKSLDAVDRFLHDDLNAEDRKRRIDALITSFALVETAERRGRSMTDQRSFLRKPYAGAKTIDERRAFVEGLAGTATFLNDVWYDDNPPGGLVGTPETRLCLEVLSSTQHTICLPLLVRYHERATLDGAQEADRDAFQDVLRSVTAFWTMWRTAKPTTAGIDNVHRGLLRGGDPESGLPALARSATALDGLPRPDEIRAALAAILQKKLKIASSSDWVNTVASLPLYRTAKKLSRYLLLLAHHNAVADDPGHCKAGVYGANETRNIEAWNAHYTIEHIAPQSRAANDTSYQSLIYDDALVDRLGNLLLLPEGINQVIDNRAWPVKRSIYAVLAETDPDERKDGLANNGITGIAQRTITTIEGAAYMPFCQFVAENPASTFDADYLKLRSRRLAELAWEQLWADLT